MAKEPPEARDKEYFEIVAKPLRLCAKYNPKFGRGQGLSVQGFRELYSKDAFYSWVGLDSPLMYAAHKAAGGMTSVYRQLGIGCQWLVNKVIRDELGLSEKQAVWSYDVPMPKGKTRTLTLDARIEIADIKCEDARKRVVSWLTAAEQALKIEETARKALKGAVFEIRQGYKSMDSKRQNADIANASNAYAHQYVPVLLLLSRQIDQNLIQRYSQARWLLLTGTTADTSTTSTYTFSSEVLGYDLAAFFKRNSEQFKKELELVLTTLLKA